MKKIVLVLSLLLMLCMASSASALTHEELQFQINELEQRVDALEDSQSSHETRISALESWKQSIQLSVNAIGAQLESVKQWLFFGSYQGENICDAIDNECGAPPIECSSDNECSPDTGGNAYCVGTDIYHDVRDWFCASPGTIQSQCSYTDNSILLEDCEYGCQDGTCIPSECDVTDTLSEGQTKTQNINGKDYEVTPDYVGSIECVFTINSETTSAMEEGETYQLTDGKTIKVLDIKTEEFSGGLRKVTFCFLEPEPVVGKVIFRTNVVQGTGENYNKGVTSDSLGAWIAFDMNKDGSLEGYGKTSGSMSTGCSIALAEIGRTPDGFKLINDTSGNLGVCYTGDKGYARKYSTSDSDAKLAVLSTIPTQPYAGNVQELYDGSSSGGGGGGGGGGGDGGGTGGSAVGINMTPES